jgi:hypothetical protein
MKKYLFGFIALTFALVIVSFTTAKKVATDRVYVYELSSIEGLSNPDNWTEVFTSGPECEGTGDPCKVVLPDNMSIETFVSGKDDEEIYDHEFLSKLPE